MNRRQLLSVLVLAVAALNAAAGLRAQIPGIIIDPPILPPPIDPPILPLGTTINFDGLAEGTVLSRQYEAQGVIFESSPRIQRATALGSSSLPNVCESAYGGDIPDHPGPIAFRFTSLMRKVTVRFGLRFGPGPADNAVLKVFGNDGRLITKVSKPIGTASRSVTELLTVDVGSNLIRRVQVHYVWETSLDGVPIEVDRRNVEAIDNLYFEGDTPPPPPPDNPPVVRIATPAHGSTVFGDPSIRVEGTITEDNGLGSMSIVQETPDAGGSPVSAAIDWAGTAPNFTFTRFPSVFRVNLRPGANVLRVTAVDSRGQTASASVTVYYGPAPVVSITAPAADSRIAATEVVVRGTIRKDRGALVRSNVTVDVTGPRGVVVAARAVNTLSGTAPNYSFTATVRLDNLSPVTLNTIRITARDEGGGTGTASVRVLCDRPDRISGDMIVTQAVEGTSLVAGRRTVVRVLPRALVAGTMRGLPALLHGFRDGRELPGSPIAPLTGPSIDVVSTDSFIQRHDSASKSWNFLLPLDWTAAGAVELTAIIDPDNTLDECESCLDSNALSQPVTFRSSGTLRVQAVRMTTTQSDGIERTPSDAESSAALEAVRRVVPYGRLEILPSVTTRPSRIVDNMRDGATDFLLETLYDRFTCYDSTDVWGWLEDTFTGCEWDTYRVGMLSGGPDGLPGGLAFVPSPGCVAEATPWVVVHELSHAIGRSHAGNGHGEGGGGGFDGRYPHPHGIINGYGFDTTDWVVIKPQYDVPASVPGFLRTSARDCDPAAEACFTHDYMSYGQNPYWISGYTWEGILRAGFTGRRGGLGGAAAGEADGAAAGMPLASLLVHVRGYVEGDGSVRTGAFYTLPTPANLELQEGKGSLEAVAFDKSGNVLARRFIEPSRAADSDYRRFSFLLPFHEGTSRIEIALDGVPEIEARVSDNLPAVNVIAPAAGARVRAADTLRIEWRGQDADGDRLSYGVQYSADDGKTWTTLAMDLTATRYDVPASELPGSAKARVRVLATDGVRSSTAMSGVFTVDRKAPYAVILWPSAGQEVPQSSHYLFEASVSDWEDSEIPDADISWSSDVDGALGTGRSLDVGALRQGRHRITLRATDSDGMSATKTVDLFVGVESVGGGAIFLRGDINGDNAIDLSDAVRLLAYLFLGADPVACNDAADANDDGKLELSDSVFLLNFLFNGGPAPKHPFPQPGEDESADSLDCEKGR